MEAAINQLPKHLRQRVIYLMKLTEKRKVEKLRALKGTSTEIKIDIYHHSIGTDSYFSDSENRYLTFPELVKHSNDLMADGATLFTSVIQYKAGVHFIKG